MKPEEGDKTLHSSLINDDLKLFGSDVIGKNDNATYTSTITSGFQLIEFIFPSGFDFLKRNIRIQKPTNISYLAKDGVLLYGFSASLS